MPAAKLLTMYAPQYATFKTPVSPKRLKRSMITQHSYTTQTRSGLLILFTLISFLFFFKTYPSRGDGYSREYKGTGYSRVAKVSMLYGEENRLYERAIRSHKAHDEKYNYPFHVLREDVAGGYWNKPSYLLSLVVAELAKPVKERTEWLM